jgi:methionyl-tRNA formyltransferase
MLLESLVDIEQGLQHAVPQDDSQMTYAAKLQKQEAVIDWQQSAVQILRQINAFNPWPVTQTLWRDDTLRIWQAELGNEQNDAAPGTVTAVSKQGIDVATGDGKLRITQLQVPGKRAMQVQDFLNANTIETGEKLG